VKAEPPPPTRIEKFTKQHGDTTWETAIFACSLCVDIPHLFIYTSIPFSSADIQLINKMMSAARCKQFKVTSLEQVSN
jgi:hypothetical protein